MYLTLTSLHMCGGRQYEHLVQQVNRGISGVVMKLVSSRLLFFKRGRYELCLLIYLFSASKLLPCNLLSEQPQCTIEVPKRVLVSFTTPRYGICSTTQSTPFDFLLSATTKLVLSAYCEAKTFLSKRRNTRQPQCFVSTRTSLLRRHIIRVSGIASPRHWA